MKIAHVSANVFTFEPDARDMKHLLFLSCGDKQRLLDSLELIIGVGFETSRLIEKEAEARCESRNYPSVSSS